LHYLASECRADAGAVCSANAYWHRENRRYRMAVHEECFWCDARVGALDKLARADGRVLARGVLEASGDRRTRSECPDPSAPQCPEDAGRKRTKSHSFKLSCAHRFAA